MLPYLFYLFTRAVFFLLVVPAIFAGAFFGLLKLGFSPRHIEVWGMAIVAGSLVLVGLKPVEALWIKFRGERPPPELPSWAKTVLWVSGGGGSFVLGSSAIFGLLAFVTVSSWWPIQGASQRLGRVKIRAESKTEDGLQRLTFSPIRGDDADAAQGLEIKGDVIAFSVRTVRFTGQAKKVAEAVGLGDSVRPAQVLTKVDESLEASQRSGHLLAPPLYLSERILRLLDKVPGVAVEEVTTKFRSLKGGFEVDLGLSASAVTLTAATGPIPVKDDQLDPPAPEPTQAPPPVTAVPEPTSLPLDPEPPTSPDPDPKDPALPPDVDPVEPIAVAPSPMEIALLRLGDPFEGL